MVERIDMFFDKYAQIIIKIADFFGVDNKSLIYMWIIISSVILGVPLKDYTIISTAGLILMNLFMLNVEYNTDNIMNIMAEYGKENLLKLFNVHNVHYRVIIMATCYYLVFCFYITFYLDNPGQINFLKITAVVKMFFPFALWLYFLQHPDLRCKKRLRERIKSAVKKLLESFPAPAPAPSAIPIIISNLFKL